MERTKRRRFTREFKVEAVQLATREGVSVGRVAQDLGVGESVLRRWCRQYASDPTHAFGGPGKVAPRDAELVQVKRELARVTRERDFLKNAAAYFAKESRCSTPAWRRAAPRTPCG